jgi:uncharacterized membrane protein YeiH
MNTMSLFSAIDFLGVIAGAFGGTLAARRIPTYLFDVGVLGLGLVSALGGRITRDILIQRGPPLALVDIRYLYAGLPGAILGLIIGKRVGSLLNVCSSSSTLPRSRCLPSLVQRGR